MTLVDSIETYDGDGELVVHAAATIAKRGAWSAYAVTLCGAEFQESNSWVAGRTDYYGLTCEECCRRHERRARVLGVAR